MTDSQTSTATTNWADALWASQQQGFGDAAALSGIDGLDAALALQLGTLDRWLAAGEALGGWKLGMTSGASRDAMGPGLRPFGFVLASRILASGAPLAASTIANLGIENELVFEFAAPLRGAAVTAADARAAVRGVALGYELNQGRLAGGAPPARVADNLSQWGIVVGPLTALADLPAGFDFNDLTVELACDGVTVDTVAARGHIDDHFETLARLARELHRFGRGIDAGQRAITGAYTRHAADRGGRWQGRAAPLHPVEVVLDGPSPARRAAA